MQKGTPEIAFKFDITWDRLARPLQGLGVVVVPTVAWTTGGGLLAFLYAPVLFLANPLLAIVAGAFAIVCLFLYEAQSPIMNVYFAGFWVFVMGLAARNALLNRSPKFIAVSLHGRWPGKVRTFIIGLLTFLALATFWRPLPLLQVSGWLAIYAVVLAFLPHRQPKTPSRWKATMLLCLVSTVLTLIMMEASIRFLLAPPAIQNTPYMPHPVYFHRLRPGHEYTAVFRLEYASVKRFHNRISLQGLRDRDYGSKAPGEYRILMLGDSFTMGHGLPQEGTFSRTLERLMAGAGLEKRIVAINGGVGDYGPWQMRGILNDIGLKLEPDLVMLQLFPGNDYQDEMVQYDKFLRACNYGQRNKVALRQYKEYWQVRCDTWFRAHFRLYEELIKVVRRDALVIHCLNNIRFVPAVRIPTFKHPVSRPDFMEGDLTNWYPELHEAFEYFMQDVRAIRDDCAEHDLDVIVYCIPEKSSVNDEFFQEMTENVPDEYERGKAVRVAEEFLEREGFQWLRVSDAILERSKTDPVFFSKDGHLNPLGARIVAEQLGSYLLDRYSPSHEFPKPR